MNLTNSLLEFYASTLLLIDQKDRYNTVLEFDDIIVVNFDCLYERDIALRATDQLLYYLHKIGNNKRFIFLSEDGAILEPTTGQAIIKNIVKIFGLTADTCLVVCREDLDIENATVVNINSIDYWISKLMPHILGIKIAPLDLKKKFAVWFHRGTIFREILAAHLHNNYREDSFISYQETGIKLDRKMQEYFQDNIDWANKNTPIIYDNLFPNGEFDFEMIVGASRKPYSEYFLEVVCETDVLGTSWVTEKTTKNLYIGKPFIVMSGPGTLKKLQDKGFKTFSPILNESYDQVENTYLRLEAIKTEIDRIAKLTYSELNELNSSLMPILKHNRKHFLNTCMSLRGRSLH